VLGLILSLVYDVGVDALLLLADRPQINVSNKKFELMLTRCAKAYSSSSSVV